MSEKEIVNKINTEFNNKVRRRPYGHVLNCLNCIEMYVIFI
jgi:hypothetical protein